MATQIHGIFDSHAHYFDRRFEAETGGADAILSQIMPDPVAHIVNVGTNPENSAEAVKQAARYAGMFAAVGIHPEDCHYLSDEQLAAGADYFSVMRDNLAALTEALKS